MDNTENTEQIKNSLPEGKSRTSKLKPKELIKKLPDHKPHLEFISAVLTIPVLITVLLLNFNSLRTKNTPTPTPQLSPVVTKIPSDAMKNSPQSTPQLTSVVVTGTPQPTANTNACIPGIGSIDIAYPQENQTVTTNPVCISINYTPGNYCSVVWAYSINGGPLSDYSNNNVCLYNLPPGSDSILLQIKSLVSNSTTSITRHFIYSPPNQPTPSLTITPTSSATASAGTH